MIDPDAAPDPSPASTWPPERRERLLEVGGHRIDSLWLEPAEGRVPGAVPLVFLHEGLGSIGQWRKGELDVPAWLVAETGCPALVYDRLGFGGSDPLPGQRAPDYLYEEAWRSLPAVLNALAVERAILIGHSDGATIALLFAAAYPERTVAVVSEAAHIIVEEVTLAGIRAAREAWNAPDGRLRAALTRYHGAKTEAMFSGWADVWLTDAFKRFDMGDQLPKITAPVLALQGDGDEYGSPTQLDLIATGVSGPVDVWLVSACRHIPHFQAADRVLPRIGGFVARVL